MLLPPNAVIILVALSHVSVNAAVGPDLRTVSNGENAEKLPDADSVALLVAVINSVVSRSGLAAGFIVAALAKSCLTGNWIRLAAAGSIQVVNPASAPPPS
jgi:hypothetical protein